MEELRTWRISNGQKSRNRWVCDLTIVFNLFVYVPIATITFANAAMNIQTDGFRELLFISSFKRMNSHRIIEENKMRIGPNIVSSEQTIVFVTVNLEWNALQRFVFNILWRWKF